MISDIDTKEIVDNSFDAINTYISNVLCCDYISQSFDYHSCGYEHKLHYSMMDIIFTLTINLNRTFIVSFDGYLTRENQTYLDGIIKHNQLIIKRKKGICSYRFFVLSLA